MVEKITITNLFNKINIEMPLFNQGVHILISENGVGKTTVLKILNAVLSKKIYTLDTIAFEKIIVDFSSGQQVTIQKNDLLGYRINHEDYPQELKTIQDALSVNNFKKLLNSARILKANELEETPLVQYIVEIMPKIPKVYLVEILQKFRMEINENISAIESIITKNFNYDLLYLPTYRRIEEDLRLLGLTDIDLLKLDEVICSGMHDVHKKIDAFVDDINHALLKKFAYGDQSLLFDFINQKKRFLSIGILIRQSNPA
ncbi:ATP-binding protein [Candidatus Magnetomorum sp. HK-1]|nr:ATP-binding protein [Candidatus Magnetomorum sp. HK-1]